MARALQINVQIDQLPDFDSKSYVGARLSAWISVGDTDQARNSDWHMLVPWEWTTADTTGAGSWDPGQKTSWAGWWVDPANPAGAVEAKVTPIVHPDARYPTTAPAEWQQPRDQMLAELAHDHRRLEAPGPSLADQTVFGFVESLSSFPAPWPELHRVWTCLQVDTARPGDTYELVIVPLFGVDGPSVAQATYKDPAKPQLKNGASGHHLWTCDYAAVTAPAIPGSAVIDRLAEAPDVGKRILLKDKFLIGGARGWASVTGQDWMIQLPSQIAEILDPAKGFTQGLEQALIQCAIANGTPPADRSAAQVALPQAVPDTQAKRSALRLLLAAAYWRVLSPAATGTRAATPLPLAFARAHPSRDNQNFLAGLTARDAARDPASLDATIPGFMTLEKLQVWTDERLQGLIGSEKEAPTETNDPVVDTPAGLTAFLLSHWQNSAAAAATLTATATPLMRFTATRWSGGHVVADPDGVFGLFDLSALTAPDSRGASISFALTTAQANAVIVAELFFDGYAEAIATIQTDPIATIGSHTLTLIVAPAPIASTVVALPPPGGGPPPPPPPPPQPSFQISIDGGTAKAQSFDFDRVSLPNRRASITLQLPAGAAQATIAPQSVSQDVVNALLAAMPEAALRTNAALLHAAPFIPSIVAGNKHDGTLAGTAASSPAEKIAIALADWAEYRLGAECDEAIRIVEALAAAASSPIAPIGSSDVTAVEPLFKQAKSIAIENAKGKAVNLFAALASDAASYALSAKAQPVVFPIDQPQPIAVTEDIWSMFAGTGVLVGSSGNPDRWPENDIWYSLNLASMYAPPVDAATNVRKPLKGLDPVRKEPFDPVPLQIGEIGGVRAAILSYENRSLVGEMPHDPVHTAPKSPRAVPRRIEAYGFPEGASGKLPALCFGKRYFFLPYLIGHGGALAPYLRDPAHPTVATKMRPKNPVTGPGGTTVPGSRLTLTSDDLDHYLAGLTDTTTGQSVTFEDLVRHTDYQRTTPVATPRISGEKDLPGVPEGVEALASEIPMQPVAITLAAGETAFFYRNQDRTDGVLDFTSADPVKRVIQIDLAGLPKGDNQSSKPKKLQIDITARDGKRLDPITINEIDWTDASLGVRIIAGRYGIEIFSQVQPTDSFVERPPRFGSARTVNATPVDFSSWQAFSVAVTNVSTSDATFIPPVVSLGTRQESDHQLSDPRQIPLPEMGQQKRVITVLDGITPSPTSLGSVTIRVRRPAVEFSTFERWINWDLADQDIQQTLDLAHKMLVLDTPVHKDDLTIDDPAVERVVVELVELFPSPEWRDRAPLATSWSAKSALIKGFGKSRSPDPKLTVRVAGSAALSKNADGSAREITLAAGGVYEIRFYGAVPEDKQGFAASLPATAARFGKGAWQGLRKVMISGKAYRLGSPLVRTFEVSTDVLPDLYDVNPMSINRLTALSGSGDRAQIGLDHDFVLNAYPKVRYVNRLSLLSQRWGWRGRPLGTMPAPQSFGTDVIRTPRPVPGFDPEVADQGRRLADGTVKDFENIAFTGRRDNDIGLVEEMKLQLAHVLPPVNSGGGILPGNADTRPPVFVKELLYRGGANWWRFALQATSRYAAMKPGQALVKYSHVDPERKRGVSWHSLVVRDRDTGRKLKRPGLMLVLPLTETVMSDVAVPPLLAIFSEPMFADFHIGDGLEAVLDYARHPLPDAPIVWTGVEEKAQELAADIAQAYADFASMPKDSTARQKFRLAVATFNAFARTQGVTLAGAGLAKAQDELSRAAAAVGTFPQPVPPAQQADYQIAKDALDLAVKRSGNADKALAKAKVDAATAEQQLQFVQEGGNDVLPNLQSEMQRFWPQIGPDPILTGNAHSGRPIPLRLDGPIGYTFDLETEAPHFGRSGFLTTPISGQNEIGDDLKIEGLANIKILPWTMARLRFRRLEATELSLSKPVPISDGRTPTKLLLSSEAIDFTKAESPPVPAEYHEGLVIDFPELDESGAGATISVLKGTVKSDPPPLWSDRFIRVAATVRRDALSIFLDSDLGPAGTYEVGLKPTSRIWLRLVLSQREKPERSEKPYEPVLDISVRLLIDDGEGDGLARSQAGAWVTIACLPLLAGGKVFRPSDPVYVNVTEHAKPPHATPADVARATGVRLTPFTAPVWCQFTQDVSTFEVKTVAAPTAPQLCPVAKLTATLDAKNVPQLGFATGDAGQPQPLQSVGWLAADETSQIRCTVAAVVTEFISDAFDRLRERPLAVYRIEDGVSGPVNMKLIWPTSATAASDIAAAKLRGARVRLMSLMYLQLDRAQPANPPTSLIDYFSEPFDSDINMDAPDAPGRIVGISKPIEVSLKK